MHFLRLIVDGQLEPGEAVRATYAVLGKLEFAPTWKLEDDLQATDQAMSYAGGTRITVPKKDKAEAATSCGCDSRRQAGAGAVANGVAGRCGCALARGSRNQSRA